MLWMDLLFVVSTKGPVYWSRSFNSYLFLTHDKTVLYLLASAWFGRNCSEKDFSGKCSNTPVGIFFLGTSPRLSSLSLCPPVVAHLTA